MIRKQQLILKWTYLGTFYGGNISSEGLQQLKTYSVLK